MVALITWYFALLLIGWIAFPLAFRLLPALADRGYALSRALGLLLWGFLFWILASLGVLQNDIGGILLALFLLVGFSVWSGWKDRFQALKTWIQPQKKVIIVTEVIFLITFLAMAFVRASNPDITGTEKPMELAFINAILHSSTFPPHDPWLSGYAISYYYFGYVMVGMLIRLTGVTSGVGFNLALASWFALTAIGAYGIVYNLLKYFKPNLVGSLLASILGPFTILIVSNLEGFLDVIHAKGITWTPAADGSGFSAFFSWLNILELTDSPPLPLSWIPSRPGGLLWWRASRVLQDFDLAGKPREIIDEFPFFSYLLGDLHPHVLAMPFVLLVVALAFNLYAGRSGWSFRFLGLTLPLGRTEFLLSAVALGGLSFLNTWDFPIYLALFSAAYALVRYEQKGWHIRRLVEFVVLAFALGIAGIILYLPFYVGFSSQAGGFLPSLIYFTEGKYFWVMFMPLLVPILVFMGFLIIKTRKTEGIKWGFLWTGVALIVLLVTSFSMGWAISKLQGLGSLLLNTQGAQGQSIGTLLLTALQRRFSAPGTWLTLGVILILAMALLYRPRPVENEEKVDLGVINNGIDAEPVNPEAVLPSHGFVILLIVTGAALALVPEFFYLRDQFGWRMNTIFKFYFQVWILWGIAAAYASAILFSQLRWKANLAYIAAFLAITIACLCYPDFGLMDRTNNFQGQSTGFTLDGTAYLSNYSPDEAKAINWLSSAPSGIVAEAVGGSYSSYARVATLSGQPDVLGWPGHESQWRGSDQELSGRNADIETLYTSANWQTALAIIQKYNIRYVYVGELERSSLKVNEKKFQSYLTTVIQSGRVVIYEVPDSLYEETSFPSLSMP